MTDLIYALRADTHHVSFPQHCIIYRHGPIPSGEVRKNKVPSYYTPSGLSSQKALSRIRFVALNDCREST
jgi:hypothetical protein